MRKIKFYISKDTKEILISLDGTSEISSPSGPMQEANLQKAREEDKLIVEKVGNELYIKSDHPVEKDNYINFVAYIMMDSLMVKKLYPEWDLEFRFPYVTKGRLVFNSTSKGLLYQDI